MSGDTTEDQILKKGRHRKKQLYNSIMKQMEFYFSDSNLTKERFLSELIKDDPYVDLSIFLKFNRIRKLTDDVQDIQKALAKSVFLKLSEDKTKVCRQTPIKCKNNVDECTIYVERIKSDTTHDWLTDAFSQFGKVVYVSIPKYSHNKMNKGFAFVEFDTETEVANVINYFESIGNIIQLPPEKLCSVKTFDENNGAKDECENEEEPKKRKRSEGETEEEEHKIKKSKKDDATECESDAQNKKKIKRNKKKCQFKEMGLQVLMKKDWKRLRNEYLNMQREKMKQLKQHLYKAQFSQQSNEKSPHEEGSMDVSEADVIQKLEFVPNVIVKLRLPEPSTEQKKLKADLHSVSQNIKFIDVQIGSDVVHLRFSDAESAKHFLSLKYNGESVLLNGNDEKEYWNRIQEHREKQFKKGQKKQRGRDKLLKKAEKHLGKHIIFEEAD